MLAHLHVYIHVYNMYECNEDPDETAQTQFPKKHCIKHLLIKLSKYTSKQYTVYWLRDITVHQALFRTLKVHALIPAKDQTLFNTIPSGEGSYEIVPVLNLARM